MKIIGKKLWQPTLKIKAIVVLLRISLAILQWTRSLKRRLRP